MNYYRANLPEDANPKAGSVVPAAQAVPAARDPYNSAVGSYYGTGYGTATADAAPNFLEYLRVLIKRRWIILSAVGGLLIIGALVTLMQTPLYTSTVRLEIDREAMKVVEGGSVTPSQGDDDDFMRTQYELLQGRTLAERVVSALKLGEEKDFLRSSSILATIKSIVGLDDQSQVSDKINRESAAVGIVLRYRAVLPLIGSRLVDISYSDPDPMRAQKIASAYADAFIASNLDKRFQANSYAKVFLEDQLSQLKLKVEQSQKALLDFGQKEQIVATNEKASIAENNLAAANAALGNLVSERIKSEELWKQLQSANAINLPQLLTNGVIDGLRVKRNALAAEYQDKSELFKPSYPAMVQLSNQIAEIDRQLAAEVNTLKASYKAAYESALSQEAEMKKQIETLKSDALDLQKRSIQYNILKREADSNQQLYDGLLQRYKQVDVAGGVGANNVFIVDKAVVPGSPSSPNMLHALLISLLLGAVVGVAAAYLLELVDDTLQTPEEVERVLGLTTLGIIPKVDERSIEQQLSEPRSQTSEAYRSLCTALQLSTDGGLPKSLLITSSGPGEGKSTTAITLSRHFATIGLRVLIIDADLRKPSLHIKFGLSNGCGLTNYLTGSATPPELFQKTDLPNLAFLASGPLPPNAADLLASSRLLSLISLGSEVFDLLIIDGPPVMGLADAPLLANATSAAIYLVGIGQVRTKLIRAALKRLRASRTSIIGSVVNRFDARRAYGYGYGYDYGYSHGYHEDDRKKHVLDQTAGGIAKSVSALTDGRESG